ncbi:super-infection exclusion protein B [Microbulbifer sp. SSSA003]|uniref:super-infection exclusion protein B n=1 Tax=Microbulbifer sp. SSSA003 TaxID=3243377 RepID=UPI004039A9B1
MQMFVKEGVRSKSLDSNDGSVSELERAGIIFQSTRYFDHGSHCQYNVTDWAWDHINKHPEVVTECT